MCRSTPLLLLALVAACAAPSKVAGPTQVGPSYIDVPITPIADVAVEIHVPGDPDFLDVFDEHSAWIMNPSTSSVELVGLDGVIDSVAVPSPIGATVMGFGSLWIANSKGRREGSNIYRIDPVSRKVEAIIEVSIVGYESTMAAGGGMLWVLSDREGTLSYIDPETNQLAGSVQVKPNSFGLASGYGSIWVTNTGGWREQTPGSIQRVDADGRIVVATIPVGPRPLFLATGEDAVWTINQGDGTVSRVDPQTNQLVATIELGVEGAGGDIAVGEGRVWVRASKVLLSVIDAASNSVVERYGPVAGSGGVRVGHGGAWVTAHDTKQVWRLPTD
jgi:virginiamycin B lyase